jgi:hypothetical protein
MENYSIHIQICGSMMGLKCDLLEQELAREDLREQETKEFEVN